MNFSQTTAGATGLQKSGLLEIKREELFHIMNTEPGKGSSHRHTQLLNHDKPLAKTFFKERIRYRAHEAYANQEDLYFMANNVILDGNKTAYYVCEKCGDEAGPRKLILARPNNRKYCLQLHYRSHFKRNES